MAAWRKSASVLSPFEIHGDVTYIFHAEGSDFYKIGRTLKRVDHRRREVQVGCPYKIVVVAVIPGSKHERHLQRLMADHRTVGEWYLLPGPLASILLTAASNCSPRRKVVLA